MMNERIKELILKAGWKNAYTNPKEGFEVVFEGEDHNLACIEKFSELIVQECADIARHNVMNISTYSDAEFVSDLIHQHFGVES